jgi:hypothetical protein
MKTRQDWSRAIGIFADIVPWAAATAVMVIGFAWTDESATITGCFLMCFIGWAVLKIVRDDLKPTHAPYLHRSLMDKAEVDKALAQRVGDKTTTYGASILETQCLDRVERHEKDVLTRGIIDMKKDDAEYCMDAGRIYWLTRYKVQGMNPSEIEFAEASRRSHFDKRCDPDICYFCMLRERRVPYV